MPGAQALPHLREGLRRHIRMAHDVVLLAQQFRFAEAAEFDEILIGVGDFAAQVGGREDVGMVTDADFATSDGQVRSHVMLSPMGKGGR